MSGEEVGEAAGNGNAFSCASENSSESLGASLDSDGGVGGSFIALYELMQLSA